jgi:hypothetical protein
MAYRELIVVATGVKAQLASCISALDLHEDAPDEVEQLTDLLSQAEQICGRIVTQGEDEQPAETAA